MGIPQEKANIALFPGIVKMKQLLVQTGIISTQILRRLKKIGTAVTKGCEKTVLSLKQQSCILHVEVL